jgi:hypothetical protein
MKVIRKNIKLFKVNDSTIFIGEVSKYGYIISSTDNTFKLGMLWECRYQALLDEPVEIKIDYENIFLTRDNLIIIKNDRGGFYLQL